MENNSGNKGNKKFLLIGILFILILGGYWTINNVNFNEVWENYIEQEENEAEMINSDSNISSMSGINEFFGYNYLNGLIFISSIMALIGGTYILLKGIGIFGGEEEDDEEDEDE